MPLKLLSQTLFADTNTLAENLDNAWGIYQSDTHSEYHRRQALDYLCFVFDLRFFDETLNEQILRLMDKRNRYKEANPEYIPNLSPLARFLTPEKRGAYITERSGFFKDIDLQNLHYQKEILDISNEGKQSDAYRLIRLLSARDRAAKRVLIYQGLFYKKGQLCDTTNGSSHGKSGYCAFTLNLNGEISLFNHFDGEHNNLVHSSTNSGAVVFNAGELSIKNGQLLTITTYSGHYRPTLFNVYRTLEYFIEKGIDISQAKIITELNPKDNHLNDLFPQVTIKKSRRLLPPSEFNASQFFKIIKERLDSALSNIGKDTQDYQTRSLKTILFNLKDVITCSDLTDSRKKIARNIQTLIKQKGQHITDASGKINYRVLDEVICQLEKYKHDNEQLSLRCHKQKDNGRLHQKLTEQLAWANSIRQFSGPFTPLEHQQLQSIY